MASGEDKDKGKDLNDAKDSDKKTDENNQPLSPKNATGKKGKSEDNPFSFKKFLQASEGQNGIKSTSMKMVNHDLAKDLPDFVQGHPSNNLPDFTLCSSSKNLSNDVSVHPSSFTPTPPVCAASIDDTNKITLPDFLSGSIGIPLLKNDSTDENESNLQLQNSLLWQKIEQLNTAFLAEKEKNEALSAQLSHLTHSSNSQNFPHNNHDATNNVEECARCEQMASHLRQASQQLNTILQAANQFSRVLTEGSQNLSNLSRLMASQSDQKTVQSDQ